MTRTTSSSSPKNKTQKEACHAIAQRRECEAGALTVRSERTVRFIDEKPEEPMLTARVKRSSEASGVSIQTVAMPDITSSFPLLGDNSRDLGKHHRPTLFATAAPGSGWPFSMRFGCSLSNGRSRAGCTPTAYSTLVPCQRSQPSSSSPARVGPRLAVAARRDAWRRRPQSTRPASYRPPPQRVARCARITSVRIVHVSLFESNPNMYVYGRQAYGYALCMACSQLTRLS
jgi:hypothetical protein